jgi:predicted phosphodiesterase
MVSKQKAQEVMEFAKEHGIEQAMEAYNITAGTFERYSRIAKSQTEIVSTDKKEGIFNWREWNDLLEIRQKLHEKASWSQENAVVKIETKYPFLVYKPLSDLHIGDIGTDYNRFKEITEAIVKIPYLYVSLLGDETDTFVSFKNQLAMLSQILSPEEQDEFVESWIEEIGHKLLYSTWGNHAEFEEKVSARNTLKKILNRNTVYFNGIGVCNLQLNDTTYKIVATHKTRYNSSFNKTHGLKQLARKDIPDADIYLSGHIHDPSYEVSFERGLYQLFMVMGTIKNNDGFGKRYFSYFSAKKDGAIILDTQQKRVIPMPSLEDALEFAAAANGPFVE